MTVSLVEDDYVRELQDDRKTPIWIAELSNGSRVFMDDKRPGCQPPSAWLRLLAHVRDHRVTVRSLRLKFRTHEVFPLPENAPGYFFSKSMLGILGGGTHGFYLVGHVSQEAVSVQRWKVPELYLVEQEVRAVEECQRLIIWNTL